MDALSRLHCFEALQSIVGGAEGRSMRAKHAHGTSMLERRLELPLPPRLVSSVTGCSSSQPRSSGVPCSQPPEEAAGAMGLTFTKLFAR
jgi:hypothetical protein